MEQYCVFLVRQKNVIEECIDRDSNKRFIPRLHGQAYICSSIVQIITTSVSIHDSLILPSTAISCSLPSHGCVEEGQTVTITCVRYRHLTVQSIISVVSQNGTAVGENSLITWNQHNYKMYNYQSVHPCTLINTLGDLLPSWCRVVTDHLPSFAS